ncbi:hypothetical protein B0A48_13016 [Cryoendolithus antarcticus]|uniref:NAD(P)-binding protein n=1 Tax=Cryoendolithus antarcticus TaxID=1507870 RepID=A0A1V8SR30_9PEZI|nr:hypothetical protein B0A48_13016 [Cryoendolithus antarcticus]
MSYKLLGKTALITGAGRGIGYEFAVRLLQGGCNVVIADVALTDNAKTLVEKYSKGSPKAVFQKTDATEWAQLQDAFDVATKTFNGLDIVCPGAGIFDPPISNFWYPCETATQRSSYKTFDLNINHPVRATQLAIDTFLRLNPEKPHGTVLLVSSIAAQMAAAPVPLYCASKAAVSSFTRSLGVLEQINGVRVVCLAPGNVQTQIWTADGVDRAKWLKEGEDIWTPIEEIVDGMIALLPGAGEGGEYEGGTVLEVTAAGRRKVEIHNDPGPNGRKGTTVSGAGEFGGAEIVGQLQKAFGK